MGKHTVTGGADFLEGVFFTTLIAYCLKFGQYSALKTLGTPTDDEYMKCTKGISEWYERKWTSRRVKATPVSQSLCVLLSNYLQVVPAFCTDRSFGLVWPFQSTLL